MSTPQAVVGLARVSNRIRLGFARLLYDGFFDLMMSDRSWQEAVIDSLAPRADDRILDFGAGSGSMAIMLALRFPSSSFIAVDPDPSSASKAVRDITRHHIENVQVLAETTGDRFSFGAGSFDKAVSVLTFHDRSPDEKYRLANELRRVLRRGGTLHVADYDKPTNSNEHRILKFTERISGPAAATPHLNGSWTGSLVKAGFVGLRRQSSQSVGIGRISVVRARKP